jgi:DNA-binding NarL/FixJ family response regulator
MPRSYKRPAPSLKAGAGVEATGGERSHEIVYIDQQCLTRDCIGHGLAGQLPELSVEARTTARGLAPGHFGPNGFALVVLNAHAGRIDLQSNAGRIADNMVATELSTLDQIAPETPLVLLSDVETAQNIIEAFRRRIRGYVPTTLPIHQVAEAIRFVWAGGTFIPPSVLSLYGRAAPAENHTLPSQTVVPDNFSPRQKAVLRRLWTGKSNKAIAYELSMCESTVKVHIRHIMKKLNVTNRTQVVVLTRPSYFTGNASSDEAGVHDTVNHVTSERTIRIGPPGQ